MSTNSDIILLFIGVAAWPLLALVLCRYQLKLSIDRSGAWAIVCLVLSAFVGLGFGDSMVSLERARQWQSSARLFVVRGVVFAFSYFALAVWLAIRSILRFRPERSARAI